MQVQEGLYIKILIWAYNRQESGFTWADLKKEFNLTSGQEQWVQKVFRSNLPAAENLIDHLTYNVDKNEHLMVITAKGVSAAIQYLNLKEAERSGKRAEIIALFAIGIGVVVGIAQIIAQIC